MPEERRTVKANSRQLPKLPLHYTLIPNVPLSHNIVTCHSNWDTFENKKDAIHNYTGTRSLNQDCLVQTNVYSHTI